MTSIHVNSESWLVFLDSRLPPAASPPRSASAPQPDRMEESPWPPFSSLHRLRPIGPRRQAGAAAAGAVGDRATPSDPCSGASGWDGGVARWAPDPGTGQQAASWRRRIRRPHDRPAPPDRFSSRSPSERTADQLALARWDTLTPLPLRQHELDRSVCLLSGATGPSLKHPVGLVEGGILRIFAWEALEAFLRRFERVSDYIFISPTSGQPAPMRALRRLVLVEPPCEPGCWP